ncbi:MAG: Bax inhibitor-1/YccA family protein, partial [Alphaproteobacteria bacterium]|nr:Bax inhibitor-1/YccA family protein [Alphaproteobacteria bacterium]
MAASAQARPAVDSGLRAYMLGIYNYMASALALTGIVALVAARTPAIMAALYRMGPDGVFVGLSPLGWLVVFAPLGMALFMGFGLQRMSVGTAQALFWSFAAVMGLSLSSIFLAYTGASIARVFFITAGMFGGMSLYGYTTRRDMSG